MRIPDYVITAIITVCVSVITAFFTSSITFRKEINKQLYQRREDIYIELFSILEKLNKDPYLVFNAAKMVKPLEEIYLKTEIFASKQVRQDVKLLYEKVTKIFNDYCDKFDGEENWSIEQARLEEGDVTEMGLQQEEENYCTDKFESEQIEKTVKKLYRRIVSSMRKDMRTRR